MQDRLPQPSWIVVKSGLVSTAGWSVALSSLDHGSASDHARRRNALTLLFFLLVAFAVVLRIVVSPQIMNRFVDYTSEGGPFLFKLHLGTYAVFAALPLVLIARPIVLGGRDIATFRTLLRFALTLMVLVVFLVVTGRFGSAGFLIDSYLVACAAGLIMLALPPSVRQAIGHVVLSVLILSAVLGIVEAVTQQRIMPFDLIELQFRPVGLSEHPLALGAICMTALGFAVLVPWPIWLRVLAVFVLFVATAVSGARFALLLAAGEILVLLMFVRWPQLSRRDERRAKAFALIVILMIGVLMVAALFAGGLLSRFGDTLFDENAMARVTIYQVFAYVEFKQLMLGMPADALIAIVNEELGLPYIESSPVVFILLFGLPVAIFFAVSFALMLRGLLRGAPLAAKVATTCFILVSLSNNALSSKTPELLILFVLLLAFSRPEQASASSLSNTIKR